MRVCFIVDFLVVVISLSHLVRLSVCERTNITVGYLTVDKTDKYIRNRQGRIISGAITYALQQVNANPHILPNHTLHLIWGDTRGDTLTAVKLLTDQWKQGVVAFFGLEDSCSVEARVAAAWNLPLISYVSNYHYSKKVVKLFEFLGTPSKKYIYLFISFINVWWGHWYIRNKYKRVSIKPRQQTKSSYLILDFKDLSFLRLKKI